MTHKQISSKGGKSGRGNAKARTTEQARDAANARWANGPKSRQRRKAGVK